MTPAEHDPGQTTGRSAGRNPPGRRRAEPPRRRTPPPRRRAAPTARERRGAGPEVTRSPAVEQAADPAIEQAADQVPDPTPPPDPVPGPAAEPASTAPAAASAGRPVPRPESVAGPGPEPGSVPRSARSTAPRRRATPPPRREPHPGRAEKLGRLVWLVLLLAASTALVADRVLHPGRHIGEAGAGLMLVLFASGLAARTGARVLLPTLLAALLAVAAILTRADPLTAGAAVATGVLGSVLAVMATKPASTFRLAAREVVVALLFASAAALGVAGFDVRVGLERFGYVVLGLSLLLAIAVVYQLGAGLHGLGRRGYVVAGTAVVVLAFALAYSRALAHWGSPAFIDSVDQFRVDVRTHLHAVPHPIEVLLGIPAIVWGVFMRARRRQGWWVCAFGVTATASASTHLLDNGVSLATTLLSAGYSLVLGLLLGYVVIRVEQLFTGTHGRRARRDEEAHAHRPEPGRLQPLH